MSKADQQEVLAHIKREEEMLNERLGAAPRVKEHVAELVKAAPTASRSDRLAAAFIELGMDERYMAKKTRVLIESVREVQYTVWDPKARIMVPKKRIIPDTNALKEGLRMMHDAFGTRFEQDKAEGAEISVTEINILNDYRKETQAKNPDELAAEIGIEVDGLGNIVKDDE